MSQVSPSLDTLPLFAATAQPASERPRVDENADAARRDYLNRLRSALRREAERLGIPLCADDAHRLMRTTPGLSMPGWMNPNSLGALFRGDRHADGRARWEMGGFTKSTREGSNDNPLRLWRLIA